MTIDFDTPELVRIKFALIADISYRVKRASQCSDKLEGEMICENNQFSQEIIDKIDQHLAGRLK